MCEAFAKYASPIVDARTVVEIFTTSTTADDVTDVVTRHLRSHPVDSASYSTLPVPASGRHRHREFGETGNRQGKFFIGGEAGLLLVGQTADDEPVAIAEVGLSLNPITNNPNILDEDERSFPRIVQMQGCTYEGDKQSRRRHVVKLLEPLLLGHALVGLVTQLASMHDFPAVGILPADANPSSGNKGYDIKRMRKRYDNTANNLGFRRSQKGLYTKNLT